MELVNPAHYQERYIKKHYPQEYATILALLGSKWIEKLYMYQHGMVEPHKCPVCGGKTKFMNTTEGYSTYCSQSCLCKDPNIKKKKEETSLKRYGVTHFTNRGKATVTCLSRYGVSNPNKLREVREKISKTNSERYGGIGFASKQLQQKAADTINELYGAPNIQQKDLLTTYPELISFEGENWCCACPHPDCNQCASKTYLTNQRTHYTRKNSCMELCTHLHPIQSKCTKSTYPEIFIRNILDEANVQHVDNSFKIIAPKELDIYCPEYNIAFECNGVYHHSDLRLPRSYHKHKKLLCSTKGIQLITIWEDQIHRIPDIVKSVVLSKLGIYKKRVGARLCTIKEIDYKTCAKFLEHNHIQGKTSTKIRLGAFYNDELVGVMTFIQSRGCQGSKKWVNGQWELNRFCTILNTQVIGLTGKMLKYFITNYKPLSIVSFSHNDISNGNVYSKLGFEPVGPINESYYYIDKNMDRWHRSTFTKSGIVARGWRDKVDDSWTEREVMNEKGYLRIYDCGTQKWQMVMQ